MLGVPDGLLRKLGSLEDFRFGDMVNGSGRYLL